MELKHCIRASLARLSRTFYFLFITRVFRNFGPCTEVCLACFLLLLGHHQRSGAVCGKDKFQKVNHKTACGQCVKTRWLKGVKLTRMFNCDRNRVTRLSESLDSLTAEPCGRPQYTNPAADSIPPAKTRRK